MVSFDTQHLQAALEPIMREAGEIILSYFNRPNGVTVKKDTSLVTDADKASEAFLIKSLKGLMPEAAFWAEESGVQGGGDYCWVIDPLDGTTNFVHGIPYFCISVALTYKGVPQVGAVYDPLQREFFYAARGQGAFLNGERIAVSREKRLAQATWLVGLPYGKSERFRALIERLGVIAPNSFAFRHLGAAALDQAYVACGRLDAVFFVDLAWWDVAAGMLLLEQAGGLVTDFAGKPITSAYRSFIGANRSLHGELSTILLEKPELI